MAHVGKVGLAALAGLIVIDVVLVTLAVQHVRNEEATAESPPAAGPLAPPEDTPTSPATGTSSPTPGLAPPADPATASHTMINAGQGDAVARAITGTCGAGGASVELSSDGGATFSPVILPSDAAVVVRLSSSTVDNARVVAADADCETYSIYTTTDGGSTWEAAEGSSGFWHVLGLEGSELQAPSGPVTASCADEASVIDVSWLSEAVAFVLCDDGTVVRTSNGGGEWAAGASVEGAIAVDFVDDSSGLLIVPGGEGCDAGLAVLASSDSGDTWEPRACVEATGSGHASLSALGERAYLAHDDSVWFSADSGATWESRSG